MLPPLVERVFLGWDRPFLERAAEWLLARRDELPRLLVVVPTAQGGRRLREALAEHAEALLMPKIMTPGSFLQTPEPEVAADWTERVAWIETLEKITAWDAYQDLFPQAPEPGGDWAGGLAKEMVNLRHALQENGLTLAAAAKRLSNSIEAGRWQALGRLENLMEQQLRSWGMRSRSRVLAEGVTIPENITGIVLAGIAEMPPLVERAWLAWPGQVTALIGAPPAETHTFSAIGRPLPCWAGRIMPWPESPNGSVRLVADTRQQATEAMHAVAEAQSPSNEVALGTADQETGDEIARTFTRQGWPAFHPGTVPVTNGLARWFHVWSAWLADPKLAVMADLLALPETAALITGRRVDLAERLSRLRNDWMAIRPADLRHRIATTTFRSDTDRQSAENVLHAASLLEKRRADFLTGDFPEALTRLIDILSNSGHDTADESAAMLAWLAAAASLIRQVNRGPRFWLDLLLSQIPSPAPQPPPGRVIDVSGWLELFYEPGRHLVLCGMNEGKVPANNAGDPWLGDAAAGLLDLPVNATRAARDAFLYQAMLEARCHDGRVDVICAKSGTGGESLLPSRFLLAAAPADLPGRVKFLFRGIEPPEAGMRWHADWQWQTRKADAPARLSATSLATWLACPFRYYLKHCRGMQSPEPDRAEWNARDFGNVAHLVMEQWGLDPAARDLTDHEPLQAWLSAALDRIVDSQFGVLPPLAVRVQTEVLRQRLAWLARVQAKWRADGWETIAVEQKIEIPLGNATVVSKIDRIDRHRDHGELRIIDYKTGQAKEVDKAHRKKITASTTLPAHLPSDSPAVYTGEEKGKPAGFLWCNLQLPLYAVVLRNRDGLMPIPCYFNVGATESDVAIIEWSDFSATDLQAAQACTEWIVSQIAGGIFWPPADKTTYDDFAILTAGRTLLEMCDAPASCSFQVNPTSMDNNKPALFHPDGM